MLNTSELRSVNSKLNLLHWFHEDNKGTYRLDHLAELIVHAYNLGVDDTDKLVRDLHKPVQGPYDNLVCEECSHMDINVDFYAEYPCRTMKALAIDLD